jgi:hypothetical protein
LYHEDTGEINVGRWLQSAGQEIKLDKWMSLNHASERPAISGFCFWEAMFLA